MIFTSNPFDRLLPAALDGRDLNPLLQDFGLIIHPPMLYMGYVGFSVAFSFAIAALLSGRLDSAWARWSRPWTIIAWAFLTLGVALGSWWAYYELGWGGWWFWDPVENASFMPWLVGTALIHSLAVTEKRGAFKNWTVLLAISAFSLSLLGTFLVRSGILTSVHSFATDPERGVYILAYLVVVIGASLMLYAWRAAKVGLGGAFGLVSRETFMLAGNVIVAVAAGTVLLGTLYPLVLDGLGLGKISVGPPYFNVVFVPLVFFVSLLIGVAPYARWKKADLSELAQRLRIPLVAAIALAALMPLWAGEWKVLAMLGFFMTFWIVFATALNVWVRASAAGQGDIGAGLRTLGRSYYGMVFAHLGVAVCVLGVTMVKNYESEQDMRMDAGETVIIGDYAFRFDGTTKIEGPNYIADRGQFLVTRDNKVVTTLFPEKRVYRVQTMPMTEAGIDTGLFRDLYVSLGEPLPGGAWSVRVYFKPFVDWIWAGAVFMALGGLLAISDRRYRLVAKVSGSAKSAAPASPPLGAAGAVEAKST